MPAPVVSVATEGNLYKTFICLDSRASEAWLTWGMLPLFRCIRLLEEASHLPSSRVPKPKVLHNRTLSSAVSCDWLRNKSNIQFCSFDLVRGVGVGGVMV